MAIAKQIYNRALEKGVTYECNCSQISEREWNKLYDNSVKANGKLIKRIIKKHLPELYKSLALHLRNDFEKQSVRTKTHLIYIHSATDYFLRIN